MKLSMGLIAFALLFTIGGAAHGASLDPNLATGPKPCPYLTTGHGGNMNDVKVAVNDSQASKETSTRSARSHRAN